MPEKQVVAETIQAFITEYDATPSEINNGQCEAFMQQLRRKLPVEECCTAYIFENHDLTYPVHVWVYNPDTETHHDAECPHGVTNPLDLPFFDQLTLSESAIEDLQENRFTKQINK